ncbi:MAG: hypothetical protein JWQ00_2909, partial [Noviherbaspirillum sp.]|nr:hypothetical protein [Noviherbaspirillum sp.]
MKVVAPGGGQWITADIGDPLDGAS